MAFSGQDGVLVWQKVKKALAGAHPAAQNAFKDLREYFATQGKNPQLQFLAFTEADCDAANGTALLTGACTVYGTYVKKLASATDNWYKVYDDATDDTTAGDQMIAIPLLTASEEAYEIHTSGLPFGTGVLVTQHTTSIGTADGSDGGDGFIIIGA